MKQILTFGCAIIIAGWTLTACQKDNPSSPEPQPPQCSITFPADSQSVTDTVVVTVSASADLGLERVDLFIDSALVRSWNSGPFNFIWNTRIYPDSSWHTIWTEAFDTDSAKGVSDTINVMVDFSRGAGQRLLLVANYNGGAGMISFLDLLQGDALARDVIGVGNTPNDLIWHGGLLYVINSMSHDLNVIGLSYSNGLTDLGQGDLGLLQNKSPQFGAIADNGFLYVSNFNTNDVTKFDLGTLQQRVFLPVGRSPAKVLAVGNKLYVCNSGFDPITWQHDPGTVSVISTITNETIGTISTAGLNPQFMALDSLGRIHVVCSGNYVDTLGEIDVIDPVSDQIVNYIYIGGTPGDIAITSAGVAYVAAGGWGGDAGRVYRYNTTTGQILNGPGNPITVNSGPMKVVAASDNSVYVACYDGDTVDKIVGDQRVASYGVGDGPSAVAIVER